MLGVRHLRDGGGVQSGAEVQRSDRRVGRVQEVQNVHWVGDRAAAGVGADGHHLGEQVLHTGAEAIQIHHSVNHHWCTAGHLLRRDLHLPEKLAGPQKQVP